MAHAPCGLMHAATGCARALTGRTVVGHAGPVCPGLQTLPLRAAFAPTGAFGSACFVVSARRSARVFPSPAAQLSPSRARLLDPSFRSCERPTDTGPANQLVRMSALYSARKPAIRRVGDLAHTRNRKPTRVVSELEDCDRFGVLGGFPGLGNNTHPDRKRTCG